MLKWYQESVCDCVIISSRIRLARNLKKYPFSIKIDKEQSENLKQDIKNSIINDRLHLSEEFEYIELKDKSNIEKLALFEKHVISHNFLQSDNDNALILKDDEKISIMINEEDHIRLQSILNGENIFEAYNIANKIDDLIEESVEYAFRSDFGYLTSCSTNIGTGLRASYMIHVPMICIFNQLPNVINAIAKFGIILRGIFGEGTEPAGNIFQISNQITLGKTEEEMISSLKLITKQIVDSEQMLIDSALKNDKTSFEDKIYRAYGTLQNARKIGINEAMNLLSLVRLGFGMELLKVEKPKLSIYNIMMNVRNGNIQLRQNKKLNEDERDIYRASYIRSII